MLSCFSAYVSIIDCFLLFIFFLFFVFFFFFLLLFVLFFLFFFKQKTAYEMRISDWSSDVCSSDLIAPHLVAHRLDQHCNTRPQCRSPKRRDRPLARIEALVGFVTAEDVDLLVAVKQRIEDRGIALPPIDRSEERRVGKECVSKCRARGAPYH